MRRRGWAPAAAAAVIVTLFLLVKTVRTTEPEVRDDSCRLDDYQTVVDCAAEHHWEAVGSTDLSLNLASYAVYPYDAALWFALYGGDCARLASTAINPDQILGADLVIVGTPISTPTLEEWQAGDRVVTCGMGIELASDANANPRAAPPETIPGTGSLRAGNWVASDT